MKICIKLLLILEIVFVLSACNLMFWEDKPAEDKVKDFYYTLSVDFGEYELDSLSVYDSAEVANGDEPWGILDTVIPARDERWNGSKTNMIYSLRVNPIPIGYFNKIRISMQNSSAYTVGIDSNGYGYFSTDKFKDILGDTKGLMIFTPEYSNEFGGRVYPYGIQIVFNSINTLPEGSISENDTIEHTWGLEGGFDSSLNE